MNRSEWATLSRWFEARWPHAITTDTNEAYYAELRGFTVMTIRTAGEQLLRSGREFLKVPVLVAACRDVARTAREWDTKQLPAADDSCEWAEVAAGLGEPGMSFAEYAQKGTG